MAKKAGAIVRRGKKPKEAAPDRVAGNPPVPDVPDIPPSIADNAAQIKKAMLTAAVRSTIGVTEPILPPRSANSAGPENVEVVRSSAILGGMVTAPSPGSGTAGKPVGLLLALTKAATPGDIEVGHVEPAPVASTQVRRNRASPSSRTPAAHRTTISSVRANRIAIVLSVASLEALIDEKLASLSDERPNARAAQDARDNAIAHYERLKRDLENLRHVAEQVEHAKVEEKIVESAATRFVQGVRNWWANEHAKICNKGLDAAIFMSCVGLCSLVGAGGAIAVAVSGALVGGKTVVEALKALPRKLP
jgi:hypothetical protein